MASQVRMDLKGDGKPVECLGQTFANDDERRAHFRELLRQKLTDPAFRATPGFPMGDDEDIINMSDPPYFTACPNPFASDFVAQYGRDYDPSEPYSREPMAVDVSVGKFDRIYKAHSYHTKVPHLAIYPSILHYTQPGDIVLDGFCGSGMTGVAAQWCGLAPAEMRLEIEAHFSALGFSPPSWGARKAVLADLSPAATYIAAGLNFDFDVEEYTAAAEQLLERMRADLGWMYTTNVPDIGEVIFEYMVWSEVFRCFSCSSEIVFEPAAVDRNTWKIRDEITCPQCGATASKERMELVYTSELDPFTGAVTQAPKRVPVDIYFKQNGLLRSKSPDTEDLEKLDKIAAMRFPREFPNAAFPDSQMRRVGRMTTTKTERISDLFVNRSAQTMSALWKAATSTPAPDLRRFLTFVVEQAIWGLSTLNRYQPSQHANYGGSQVNRQLNGVYYISSMYAECSPWHNLDGKVSRLRSALLKYKANRNNVCISTGTATHLPLPDNSVDYIFTDPPFGENIYYADLNFLVESWHGVVTSVSEEAIVDRVRSKDVLEYEHLMRRSFEEYFRTLKPGRWMTVVFSNSKTSVWNAIQIALQQAGFIISEVATLDKKQGSFKQVTSATAVKQDLVISAYKPNGGLEDRFYARGVTDDTAWDFVRTHLKNLSIAKKNPNGDLRHIDERDARRLFDRMVAWFVRHNTPVPLSSAEFQAGLAERFPERDGMFFLPNQIDEYDKARMQAGDPPQRDLFVDDERTAIDWLTDFLKAKPSTYQEVHPDFTQKTGAGWRKHETKPELTRLLDENFLKYDGTGPVPSQIHAYLSSNWKELRNLDKDDAVLVDKARNRWFVPDPNKQQDVEARREKALLREFETYKAHKGRKMKEIRLEVMRVGFKAAWAAKDYRTIIDVSAKVPDEVWQEDERLMMLHSMAETRLEAER